ncbi:MAG: PAS domain S-box protein [Deltaproteobacteria bacterium]|nr:PAS domain S-box protein [Deltaproteobacteria bacterium]
MQQVLNLVVRDRLSMREFLLTILRGRIQLLTDGVDRLSPMIQQPPGRRSAAMSAAKRKQTQDALRRSEEEFRATFELAGIGRSQVDPVNCQFLRVNQKLCEMFGYSREELIGKSFLDLTHPDDRARNWETVQPFLRGEVSSYTIEKRYLHKDGHVIWCSVTASMIKDAQGKPRVTVTDIQDITERKLAEEALRESEQRLNAILQTTSAVVYLMDAESRFIHINRRFEELFGIQNEEIRGKSVYDVFSSEIADAFNANNRRVLTEGRSLEFEEIVPQQDGVHVYTSVKAPLLDLSGRPCGIVGVSTDITERKKIEDKLRDFNSELEKKVAERTTALEEANAALLRDMEERKRIEQQLRESQKMESIGTLAGGIAHDFNNILNVIRAYASLLEEHRCNDGNIAETLKVINDAIEKGSSTVRQLMTIASKTRANLGPLDINAIMDDLARFLKQTFPKTVEISLKLRDDVPSVVADRNQIDQALLNLCLNARDAMPAGGRLTLRTGAVDAAEIRKRYSDAEADRYVFIEVADTGEGMDEGVRSRIFDPFFTTKETGKGTGLGLPVVYGIVRNHNGFIDVESQPKGGTVFRIYLPVIFVEKDAGLEALTRRRALETGAADGAATILIVEDEENMLSLLRNRFTRLGFRVLAARDGEEAISLFLEHKRDIDVVLLDIGLPKISGQGVLLRIKKENPDIAVVVASGYVEPELKADLLKAGVKAFVDKPYDLRELAATVRAAFHR